MDIQQMGIEDLHKGYENKHFSVKEVVKGCIDRIRSLDDKVNALITVCEESALMEAEEADKKLAGGEKHGSLEGVPVVVSDNICTRGIRTTCASKALEDFIPPYDAEGIQKLKAAGAIIIGKANMDQFSMGCSTETSVFKTTVNPWDFSKVSGGASGGTAAAISAGFAPVGIGSDSGGSIRQSSAYCGVVGLKPTYGTVSRYGLVAFAPSLEQVGALANNVIDCARIFSVIKEKVQSQATANDYMHLADYEKEMRKGLKGLKVGVRRNCFKTGLDNQIYHSIENTIKILVREGAVVEEVSLPDMRLALSAYYIISSVEASSALGRFDGIRYGYRTKNYSDIDQLITNSRTEGFGSEVKRRIMLGTLLCSSDYNDKYYKKAAEVREHICKAFSNVFKKYDIILTPSSPVLPFNIGEKAGDPIEMYKSKLYTTSVNLAGVPALSLPCGFSKDGLPIGLQLVGDYFCEHKIFRTAAGLEKTLNINPRTPQLSKRVSGKSCEEEGCLNA